MFRKVFVVVMLFMFWASAGFAQGKTFKKLSSWEFQEELSATEGEVLVDLRTPDEVKHGVIPGAVQLDYFEKDFESQVGKLDPNKTYFIYCASGGRSGETFDLMKKLGFREVYELPEGFAGWQKAKLPVGKLKKP